MADVLLGKSRDSCRHADFENAYLTVRLNIRVMLKLMN